MRSTQQWWMLSPRQHGSPCVIRGIGQQENPLLPQLLYRAPKERRVSLRGEPLIVAVDPAAGSQSN